MKTFLCAVIIIALFIVGCSSAKSPSHPTRLPIVYHNAQYDLTFYLPAGWHGYSVLVEPWEGGSYIRARDRIEVVARGSVIILRHPHWKADAPRQDIPIMIFTRNQWEEEEQGKFFPYAGGVIDELWHNQKYVFGLFSRYGAAENPGGEEVADVIERNRVANPMPHLHDH